MHLRIKFRRRERRGETANEPLDSTEGLATNSEGTVYRGVGFLYGVSESGGATV